MATKVTGRDMAQSERQKYSTENKSTLLEPIFIVDMITGTLAFTLFDNGLHGWPTRKKKLVTSEVRGNIAHAHQGVFFQTASQCYVFKEPEGWNLLSA